jgi:hypothetical protein
MVESQRKMSELHRNERCEHICPKSLNPFYSGKALPEKARYKL